MEKSSKWRVLWEDGTEKTFVPYDSLGFTSFVQQGLLRGLVTINGSPARIEKGWVKF